MWQWFENKHLKAGSGPYCEKRGFCHTNSVTRLANGNTLISLRNFHTLVGVNSAGDIVWSLRDIKNEKMLRYLHDPEILHNVNILVSVHRPQGLLEVTRDGDMVDVFIPNCFQGSNYMLTFAPIIFGVLLIFNPPLPLSPQEGVDK